MQSTSISQSIFHRSRTKYFSICIVSHDKCHGCLPSTFTRIKSCAAAADFQQPLKEFRVESRNEALCAWEKTGRTSLEIACTLPSSKSYYTVLFIYLYGTVSQLSEVLSPELHSSFLPQVNKQTNQPTTM